MDMHAVHRQCCVHVFASQLKLTNQNAVFGHPVNSPLLSVIWMPFEHLHSVVTEKSLSIESLSMSNSLDSNALYLHLRLLRIEIMSTFQILEKHRRQ